MSTDFSIRPVGVPAPSPIPLPAPSKAADNAVATELPATKSVTVVDASASVRNDPGPATSTSRQVVFDREAGSVVFEIVDKQTREVVEQFPEEAVLRRRAYFRSLDLAKNEPTRVVATDVKA